MASSLSEVARLAGVSESTASSVLTKRRGFRVSPETAARIREAAERLEYRPNRLARALATGSTRLIALIDYDFGANFSAHLGRQFHLALGADGYDLVVFGQSTPPDAVAGIVDGVICSSREVPPGLDDVLPVVQISSNPDTRQDAIRLDLKTATAAAMRVFERAGCDQVAFLGPASGLESFDGRLAAYRDFVAESGRTEILVETESDRPHEGYQALGYYAETSSWPVGIFCRNDELALGAYRAIRESGRTVGNDIAVIGCDDIGGGYFDPPLTSMALPFKEISETAWSLLRERIASPDLPSRSFTVTPELIERASSQRRS
ncbi:MAG: LacI family DNA-binding transcriptional regulator [Fimbriimonas sp.]|nr:LacI family DNA-binding transcriptional regulator [Fimbriimonas sp.]